MFEHFQTTGFILIWLFAISFIMAGAAFYTEAYQFSIGRRLLRLTGHQPALALAALMIFLCYHYFKLNLIFPIHLISDTHIIFLSAIAPAIILLLASGLGKNIVQFSSQEFTRWSTRQFFRTRKSMGLPGLGSVRRLVLMRSLVMSWNISLPWVFSEILIIESVFNAPGLGLSIWQQAKMRDFEGLLMSTLMILIVYLICFFLSLILNKWLGRKLEGYV